MTEDEAFKAGFKFAIRLCDFVAETYSEECSIEFEHVRELIHSRVRSPLDLYNGKIEVSFPSRKEEEEGYEKKRKKKMRDNF